MPIYIFIKIEGNYLSYIVFKVSNITERRFFNINKLNYMYNKVFIFFIYNSILERISMMITEKFDNPKI